MAKHHRQPDQRTLCGSIEFDDLSGLDCSLCKTLLQVKERATAEGRHGLYTVEDVKWVLERERERLKVKEKE